MIEHTDDLTLILTAEQGKPLAEAKGEIVYGASFIEWFAEEGKRVAGDTLATPASDKRLVLNIVTGDPKAIGGALTSSPVVRKLSFTGSTGVGRRLMAQSAPSVKKVTLELGGNAPFIVFDDADLDAAVGKVEAHIADALDKGATLATGGKRHALGHGFFEPTVLLNTTAQMDVAREETFGPLAPLFRFSSDDEVVKLANDTEFGLAAYFYSRDIGRVWRVAEQLEYGMVGINTGLISNEVAPFGGVKQSGLGREGSHYGIDDYLVIKYLCMAV